MRLTFTGLICLFVYLPSMSMAQLAADSMDISSRLASRYTRSIGNRSESVKEKMDLSTQKYLGDLKKQEQALQTKLNKINPAAADKIFRGSEQQYDKLQNDRLQFLSKKRLFPTGYFHPCNEKSAGAFWYVPECQ